MKADKAPANFLRRALLANAFFSLISGVILIVAAQPLSQRFGLAMPGILIAVGASLLVYAAALFRNALRKTVSQSEAFLAVVLDMAWVVGSAIVILAGLLNTMGNWAVAIVADVVLLFAVLQYYGPRRIRQDLAPVTKRPGLTG